MTSVLPLATLTVLVASVVATAILGRSHPALAVRVSRAAGVVALGCCVGMLAGVGGNDGGAVFRADRLGAAVSLFVTAMSVIVGTFASRYLALDARAPRFFAATNGLVASTLALALADRVWLLAASWIAVSVFVVGLIGFDGREASRLAARRARRAFLVGDLAVVIACAVAGARAGFGATLADVARAVGDSSGWIAVLVGSAVLVAAAARSAQVPFSGWLISTVAAPTPVSAMLHAGVVNGSALLLIRSAPVLTASTPVTAVMVAVSIAGVVGGMAIGRTRPDVKSGLAWTTVAQMGFMTLQCALGLPGMAVVHMMAHGMFKASLFLGAGSGLEGAGSHRHPATAGRGAGSVLGATGAAAAVVASVLALVRPEYLDHPAALVPVAFAVATLAYCFAQWTSRAASTKAVDRVLPLLVVWVGFAGLALLSSTVDHWLTGAAIPVPAGARWFGAVAVAAVGIAWLAGAVGTTRAPRLAARAWMWLAVPALPPVSITGAREVPVDRPGSSSDTARRARLRSTVERAAESVPGWQPLETFVAMNPIGDLESMPIEAAASRAAGELGLRSELDEESYRAIYRSGRITPEDLNAAIREHLVSVGDGSTPSVASFDQVRSEMLTATAVALPAEAPILLSEWHDRAVETRWADRLDELAAWWCAAYLSDHPAWPMPMRDLGLGGAWRALAPHDGRLARLHGEAFANVMATLPERDDDAVMQLLVDLGVDRPDHEAYLRRHLTRLHGWAGALIARQGSTGDDVVAYLMIRLSIEAAMLANTLDRKAARACRDTWGGQPADDPSSWRLAVWRDAYERGIRDHVLSATSDHSPGAPARVAAQAVFCIDPRSEGMRRHLEAQGPFETIGYAGFFGLPIGVVDLDRHDAVASCPVILEPTATAVEVDESPLATTRARRIEIDHTAHRVFSAVKRSTAGPFALAESFGWMSGVWMAARTLAPGATAALTARARRRVVPEPATAVRPLAGAWWTPEQEVEVAASILRTTGLDRAPAPLVLLCGHGSHHVNNLHKSTLQCGACGGRPGANNARVAARLLNDPAVRLGLREHGIVVADTTWFVAGEHDTTSDRVRILDRDDVPAARRAELDEFEARLEVASRRLREERMAQLPGTVGRTASEFHAADRGSDWAQVAPELGLLGNASMIIGPRSLTRGVDLERRAFLHSYEADRDADSSTLAAILAGPLVVAHGISSLYRLSAIDPERCGAGTKTAHSLVGGVGVLDHPGGDLRTGLPRESVGAMAGVAHEPLRLLVVIDATTEQVDRALAAVESVATLARNGWIRIAARPTQSAPDEAPWMLLTRNLGWVPWDGHPGVDSHRHDDERVAVPA